MYKKISMLHKKWLCNTIHTIHPYNNTKYIYFIFLINTYETKNYNQIHIRQLDHCHELLYDSYHKDKLVGHLDFVD